VFVVINLGEQQEDAGQSTDLCLRHPFVHKKAFRCKMYIKGDREKV
jgi:hypothetical protein